jgi:hypothetical protein
MRTLQIRKYLEVNTDRSPNPDFPFLPPPSSLLRRSPKGPINKLKHPTPVITSLIPNATGYTIAAKYAALAPHIFVN